MRYELAVEIARPPADVYAFLADPTRLAEWQSDVQEVRDATGGPLTPGATFTEVRAFLGKRVESTLEAVVAEPGRELTLETVSGPVRVSIQHLLEPKDDGTTLRVVAERFTELPDRVRKHFLRNERSFPDLFEDLLLADDLSGAAGQNGEHLHRLRLDVSFPGRTDDGVGVRLDEPFAEPEVRVERHETSLGGREEVSRPPSPTLARELDARPNVS